MSVKSGKQKCPTLTILSDSYRQKILIFFLKTSKQVQNLGKNKTNIPTLIFNGEHADGDTEKANMLNDYFSSQTLINDQNKHLPHLDLITDKTLEYITVSEQEIRDVLKNLDTSKAHGPDHVSPHFLRKVPQLFLNHSPLSLIDPYNKDTFLRSGKTVSNPYS